MSGSVAVLRRVRPLLARHRRRIALAVLVTLSQALLTATPALALHRIVGDLDDGGPSFARLAPAVGVLIGALLVSALLGVLATWLTTLVSQSVAADLRERLFSHLVGQGPGFHARARPGELLSRITSDVGVLQSSIDSAVVQLLRTGVAVVVVTLVMLVLDWRLALVALVFLPVMLVVVRRAGTATARARLVAQQQTGRVTEYLHESLGLSGVLLVRAFGRERAEEARFAGLNAELRRVQVAAAMAARWSNALLVLLGSAVPLGVLVLGGWLVSSDRASLATVLVFSTVLVAQFGSNLQGLSRAAVTMLGSVPVWQRVFDVLDTPLEVAERPGARDLAVVRGAVRFEDVDFGYPGEDRLAISGVTLDVPAGTVVGIVGPSAAGKTTLTSLIARFVDPDRGRVTLDGVDLRDLRHATIGRAVGIVLQDPFLFHASVADNVRFGRPGATDADLERVAVQARLAPVLDGMPDGWDTVVGERGHRLSGGEKQRVALARVLLVDPAVVVLDEATAHLDAIAERQIQEALSGALDGRTAFVVAHRLGTVRDADLIVVMDGGRIVEQGTHEALLEAGGLYARLHALDRQTTQATDV